MNRKQLAKSIKASMGEHGGSIPVVSIERMLAALPACIRFAVRRKDRIVIDNLFSLHHATSKERLRFNVNTGEATLIPSRNRVKVVWSRKFMDELNNEETEVENEDFE